MTDIEPSKELDAALNGDRAEALRFWHEIAQGKVTGFTGEAELFIVAVAANLIEADKTKGTARLQQIVNAVCLGGKQYPHIELRERLDQVSIVDDFHDLDAEENTQENTEANRKASSRGLATLMAAAREIDRYKDMDDKELRDLIYALRKQR